MDGSPVEGLSGLRGLGSNFGWDGMHGGDDLGMIIAIYRGRVGGGRRQGAGCNGKSKGRQSPDDLMDTLCA